MSRFVLPLFVVLAGLTACDRNPPKPVDAKVPPTVAAVPANVPALPSVPADIAEAAPVRQAPRQPRAQPATPGAAPRQAQAEADVPRDDGRTPGYDGEWSPEDDAPPIPEPGFDRDDEDAREDTQRVGSHWGGVGDAQFGMDFEEVEDSWPGRFRGDDSGECFYAETGRAGAALMFERGRFVRYDVDSPALQAPGGGQVGMEFTEILEVYGRVERLPHKYTDGEYLRVESPRGDSVLVFETDPDGVVTAWRIGVEPQVDYVEGCS